MVQAYEEFKAEVLKLTGINLNSYKERQMKRRIDSLIRKSKFTDYNAYIQNLKTDKEAYEEFINYLTINVSEFFRNPRQWKVLEESVLPYLLDKFSSNLKIWSAACSTGDEPYSLAILLSKYIPLNKINIIATDIDKNILDKAKLGIYKEKSIETVPEEFKRKYFKKVGNSYQIIDEIKNRIEFKEHDLLKDEFPQNCHLIVCRNVLIYFTEEAKNEIYKKFNKSLYKNAILFVGSTEQIIQASEYKYTPMKAFFYKKNEELL